MTSDETQTPTAPSAWRSRLTTALAVLVLLGTVAVVMLGVQLQRAGAEKSAVAKGQVIAARHAEQLLSYHHAHLERDFSDARALMTDSFISDYDQAAETVQRTAVTERAVVRAKVVASSIVDAEPDRVKALLFVNQVTSRGKDRAPSLDLNRVMITLVRDGDTWLVSDLDAL